MDCPSYTFNPNDILGNRARCYYCGTEFVVSPNTLRYVHLKCGTNLEACRENIADFVEADAGGVPADDALRRLIEGALDPDKVLDAAMTASVRKAIGESRSDSEQEVDVSSEETNLLSNIVKQANSR
jgi:hypothetical protein